MTEDEPRGSSVAEICGVAALAAATTAGHRLRVRHGRLGLRDELDALDGEARVIGDRASEPAIRPYYPTSSALGQAIRGAGATQAIKLVTGEWVYP
jgi:hypothetical protein